MKSIASLLAILLYLVSTASGQDSRLSGGWDDVYTWSTYTRPAVGVVTIKAGHTVTISGSEYFNGILKVYGTLIFIKDGGNKGRLLMDAASSIELYSGSNIMASGNAGSINSNQLQIGNTMIKGPAINAIVEPNTLTEGNLASGGECASGCEPTTSILPVELLSYTASKVYSGVQLAWVSLKEWNFSHYQVWHSTNGYDYSLLAEELGRGNELSKSVYQYLDIAPKQGNNYYKLIAIDVDGSKEEHGVQHIVFGQQYLLWPNPATQQNVQLTLSGTASVVRLLNSSGKQILERTTENTQLTLPTANLPSGVYLVQVSDSNSTRTEKLLVE